jgi:hypothetical protein
VGESSPKAEVLSLFTVVVFAQTTVALVLTRIAQATNTMGLAWVALGVWLAASVLYWLRFKDRVQRIVVGSLAGISFLVSFATYMIVGYHMLGWQGLMK